MKTLTENEIVVASDYDKMMESIMIWIEVAAVPGIAIVASILGLSGALVYYFF